MNGSPTATFLLGDAQSYYEWALRLVSGDWAGGEVFYQAPLYPYFLGGLFSLFEPDPSVVRWAQAFLGALACVFIALSGRSWFSPPTGIIAGLLLALYGPAIFFVGLVQKTTVALVLFALLLWLLGMGVRGGMTEKRAALVWTAIGSTLGVTALARENALVFLVPIAAWLALGSLPPRIRARSAVAFLFGVALILSPVALRNYVVGGDFALTTSQLGTNLYIGNNAEANGTYQPLRAGRDDPRFEAIDARAIAEEKAGRSLEPSEVSSFYVGEVVDFIRRHPLAWSQLMLRKIVLAAHALELSDTEDLATHAEQSAVLKTTSKAWHYGALLPLAVVGGVLTWPRRRDLKLLHWLMIAYGAGLVAFFIFARYRFLLVPMLVLFAAVAATEILSALRQARYRAVLAAIAMGLVSAVVANWPFMDSSAMQAVTHFNYGLGFERSGKEEQARESYLRALSFQPNIAEAHYRVGILDAQEARTDAAIEHFRAAIALSPDYHDVRNSLGVLLLRRGDVEGAEEQFREALRLLPKDSQALNNLATIAFQRRDLKKARSLYQRSAEADPKNAQTHNNLGIIAAILGEMPLAIRHFEDALAIDPGYEEARMNLARAESST